MAHSLSAKKRIRQNDKRRARNRARKEVLKTELKSFNALVTAGNVDKAAEQLNTVVKKLDRIASKNTIHKNTAARKRSRLTKRLHAIKAKKAGVGTSGAKA